MSPPSDDVASAESWFQCWGRRAITIPGYLILAAFFLGGLPLWLTLAAAIDLVKGSSRVFPRTRATSMFAVYFACEVVGIVGALALGAGTLGGRIGGSKRYLSANAALQRWWTSTLFLGSVRVFGMKIVLEGLEHAARGPMLLFVRHTSSADTVLTAAMVTNPKRIVLRYVLKRELLLDPSIDLVGKRLPNAFLARTGERAHAEKRAIAGLARGLDAASAVLIYPEGTRFDPVKRARAIASLKERGHTDLARLASELERVLPPKLGGALALLDAAPDVDVVFIMHTGFEGAATFAEFWGGGLVHKTIKVQLRRIAATTIPKEGRDAWLFECWREVDLWVRANQERLPYPPAKESLP